MDPAGCYLRGRVHDHLFLCESVCGIAGVKTAPRRVQEGVEISERRPGTDVRGTLRSLPQCGFFQ